MQPPLTTWHWVFGAVGLIALIGIIAGYSMFSKGEGISLFKDKKVKVVVSFPVGVSTAQSSMNAVKLAFKQVGYKAGPYEIELVEYNDGDDAGAWVPEKAKEIATRAANDKDVVAFIGPQNSGASKIIIPILNRAGILHVNPSNTWPGLTRSGFADGEPDIYYPTGVRNYFRVVTTDDIQGEAAAMWAEELGFKSVYVIDDGGTYGKGLAELFAKRYAERGFEVRGTSTISDTKATTFPEIVDAIAKSRADFVYYGGDLSSGISYIIPEVRKAGFKGRFMGPDAILGQDFITRTGKEYAEGTYVTSVGIPASHIDSPQAEKFLMDYVAEYGSEPEVFGSTAYEAAQIVIKAIEKGEGDRTKILQLVQNLNNYVSMFGPISFDKNGDVRQKHISANVVDDGAFIFIKPLLVE